MTNRKAREWLSRMQRAMLCIEVGRSVKGGRYAYESVIPVYLKDGNRKSAAAWFRELADALEKK